MMYYRRKVILALLEQFDGEMEKMFLHKMLFLFCQRQTQPEYDFVPYKYGCYSYSAKADLFTMVKKDMLSENSDKYKIKQEGFYTKTLKPEDRRILQEVVSLYGEFSTKSLVKHTYLNYPYWAINSLMAKEVLTTEELQKVENSKPKDLEITLFTIGYEGISLESYLNKLIKNNISLLVDVRKNPLSMKYGFSKKQLKEFCENLGILYLHIPEVGIDSDQWNELNTQKDYDELFIKYKKYLSEIIPTQHILLNLLIKNKRIALTCFEADVCQCHRKHLAESIQSLEGFDYHLKHI